MYALANNIQRKGQTGNGTKLGRVLDVNLSLPPNTQDYAITGYGYVNVQVVKPRESGAFNEAVAYTPITVEPQDWQRVTSGAPFPVNGVYRYPVWVVRDEDDYRNVSRRLGDLAKLGVLVGFGKELWAQVIVTQQREARKQRNQMFKHLTAHNDKLGVDFSNARKGYVAQYPGGRQFSESVYNTFLEEAAAAHSAKDAGLAGWFKYLSGKFDMATVANPGSSPGMLVKLPQSTNSFALGSQYVDVQKHRELEEAFQQAQDRAYVEGKRANKLAKQFDRLRGSAVMRLDDLSGLPAQVNANIMAAKSVLPSETEIKYQRCLVDPSHPHVRGVRVPRIMPEESATYCHYQSVDTCSEQFLIFANLEMVAKDDFAICTDKSIIDQTLNNAIEVKQVMAEMGGNNYGPVDCHVIMYDAPIVGYKGQWQTNTYNADDDFSKCLKVGSCIQLTKTSCTDTEAGTLDMVYRQNGMPLEAGSNLSQGLGKPARYQNRSYLAQAEYGNVRGKVGFLGQTNFRPYDDRSFEYQNANSEIARKKYVSWAGQNSGLWCLIGPDDDEAADHFRVQPLAYLADNATVLGIVAESMAQRHTAMWYARGMTQNMHFTVDVVTHYEGLPDPKKSGFATYSSATLPFGVNTMDVVAGIRSHGLFNTYEHNRQRILGAMMQGNQHRMGSYWDETLFPGLMHMINYGADKLNNEKFIDSSSQMISDAVAAALSMAAPELAELILPGSKFLKPTIQKGMTSTLDAVQKWSDTQQNKQTNSKMGKQLLPSCGESSDSSLDDAGGLASGTIL